MRKPTIAELEEILASPGPHKILIRPDGEITTDTTERQEGAAAERARIVACLVAFAESAEEAGKTEWGIIYRSAAEAIADGAADCIERGDQAPPVSR